MQSCFGSEFFLSHNSKSRRFRQPYNRHRIKRSLKTHVAIFSVQCKKKRKTTQQSCQIRMWMNECVCCVVWWLLNSHGKSHVKNPKVFSYYELMKFLSVTKRMRPTKWKLLFDCSAIGVDKCIHYTFKIRIFSLQKWQQLKLELRWGTYVSKTHTHPNDIKIERQWDDGKKAHQIVIATEKFSTLWLWLLYCVWCAIAHGMGNREE